MYLRQLQLIQFRNYDELLLSLSEGINCFTGANGAGKTNILDAVHFLAFTKGFRSSQDQQAVQKGADFFFNGGKLIRKTTKDGKEIEKSVQCNYQKGKGKKVMVDLQPLKRMSDHIGYIPMVSILPSDTDLINGPSAGRRQFMDMLISQYDQVYLRNLIQYNRVIDQRNALLRQFASQGGVDQDQLDLWNMQMVPLGIAIQKERARFTELFMPVFEDYFKKIVSEQEKPGIRYNPNIHDFTEEAWHKALKDKEARDLINQYTGLGIQRDDLVFQIDDRSVRNFGSQGQQKTFVISLKLAQYALLQNQKKLPPILLLDDIFDKLDKYRLAKIAGILDEDMEGQIFITDTSLERMKLVFAETLKKVKFFEVQEGRINEVVTQ
ncbi:MAG: DNA replication/repair protein RecF [Bacteroidia bacterium]|nr:DNA replication/repair protein RecF [Bacteroidia bacterium]